MAEPTNPEAGAMLPATRPATGGEIIKMSLDTVQGFEALQRAANLLSASTIVPETYRRWTVDKDGNRKDNPNGLANCVVALNMASRMGADPIMITQNMHVIEGRPSWSSVFIIAAINQSGRFSPLRFDVSEAGSEIEAEYTYTQWEDTPGGKRRPVDKIGKMKVRPQTCRAWAVERATGLRLDGPEVSIQLALDEGWIQRKGSKWRTMPEVMLRYRAASLFGKLYAPELLMGLQSREEIEDIVTIDAETGEVLSGRRDTPRVVGSSSAPLAGMPKALGDWTIEQLDELEELIEKATGAMRDAGFVKEAGDFESRIRASRANASPEALLAELRSSVAAMTAPAPQADTAPSSAEVPAPDASEAGNPDGSLIADPDARNPVVGKARGSK